MEVGVQWPNVGLDRMALRPGRAWLLLRAAAVGVALAGGSKMRVATTLGPTCLEGRGATIQTGMANHSCTKAWHEGKRGLA